jgi:hypothetical protein
MSRFQAGRTIEADALKHARPRRTATTTNASAAADILYEPFNIGLGCLKDVAGRLFR